MNKVNNQIRIEEFEKRRVYKGSRSFCQAGYDCPIFMNCLLEINQLKKQLEEKDKVINEAINFINNTVVAEYGSEEIINIHEFWFVKKIKEILERGKNGK